MDHKEGWAERIIDVFKLWCWKKNSCESLGLERESNQSILKETNSDYSLEERMQKLTPGYFLWPPDLKSQLIGKNPDAGKG